MPDIVAFVASIRDRPDRLAANLDPDGADFWRTRASRMPASVRQDGIRPIPVTFVNLYARERTKV